MNKLLKGIDLDVDSKVNEKLEQFETKLSDKMKEVDQKIASGVKVKIEYNNKTTEIKGMKHGKFAELLAIAGQRMPVMLVGAAGTGKTHGAEQVSKALGLPFYSMSVGAQTSKADIVGFKHANGGTVTTSFYKAYKEGGVFLMDEIDAGNSNVLIQINSALSNGYMGFPDGMVKMHKDFIFIATANTYGQGATREYVGRNQLDSATLDRFVTVDWNLDERLETSLVKPYENGESWLKVVKEVRNYADQNKIRMLVTPRASINGARLLDQGLNKDFVIEATLLSSAPQKSYEDIKRVATNAWKPVNPITGAEELKIVEV